MTDQNLVIIIKTVQNLLAIYHSPFSDVVYTKPYSHELDRCHVCISYMLHMHVHNYVIVLNHAALNISDTYCDNNNYYAS